MTPAMYLATAAWALLVIGWLQRTRRTFHICCMSLGITLDVLLVGYLELTRGAVEKALSLELAFFKQLHIAASSVALVLYLPVVYLGIRLIIGRASARQRRLHIRIGLTALVFRTAGFILMFSMLR